MRNLHAIARAYTADVKHARMGESVQFPFLRRIKRWSGLAGGAAAGLQLHWHRLHARDDVAVDQAEGRVLFLILLDVARIEHRQLHDVVDALDVARLETFGGPTPLVEFVLPARFYQIEELFVLERADFVG